MFTVVSLRVSLKEEENATMYSFGNHGNIYYVD